MSFIKGFKKGSFLKLLFSLAGIAMLLGNLEAMEKNTSVETFSGEERPFKGAFGTMSGTSLDGVDIAYLETNGEEVRETGKAKTYPYPPELRRNLAEAVARAPEELALEKRGKPLSDFLQEVQNQLTLFHYEVLDSFIEEYNLKEKGQLVGFHGHTLLHDPQHKYTFQLGDWDLLQTLLKKKYPSLQVIENLRWADIKAGGQGAPLAPVYHYARVKQTGTKGPVVILNIGGVANCTYLDGQKVIGFDTGTGGALLNDWMDSKTSTPMDQDGAAAARGTIHTEIVEEGLKDPYFSQSPPKSLDRNHFAFLAQRVRSLSLEDGAATLTAFTAASVAHSLKFFPEKPQAWYVTGGNRLNKTLLKMIEERVQAPVKSVEDLGWNGDSLEAELMAFLAVRHFYKLPLSYPFKKN